MLNLHLMHVQRSIGPYHRLSNRLVANYFRYLPSKFLLFQFPLCISHPIVHINPIAPDIVLKLFPLPALEFMEFFEIRKALGRCLKARLLTVNSFPQKLFGRDLLRRRGLVLDPWRAS